MQKLIKVARPSHAADFKHAHILTIDMNNQQQPSNSTADVSDREVYINQIIIMH
jgi:hypothetical protein